MGEQKPQRFFIGYEEDMFVAYPVSNQGTYHRSLAMYAYELEELLEQCRDAGLTQFEGLTKDAVGVIYDWLVRGQPAVQFVEGLWDEQGTASRRIGFRVPKPDDSAC